MRNSLLFNTCSRRKGERTVIFNPGKFWNMARGSGEDGLAAGLQGEARASPATRQR